jgi:hypothetical protein
MSSLAQTSGELQAAGVDVNRAGPFEGLPASG